MRLIREVAKEILSLVKNKSFYWRCQPYLKAMLELDKITDKYGWDDATSILLYFKGNVAGWRGEDARRLKKELDEIINSPK